jgi:hypothetical protein
VFPLRICNIKQKDPNRRDGPNWNEALRMASIASVRDSNATNNSKTKCCGARFNPLVHHARSCDDNSVQEVGLPVTAAFNARSASPDCSRTRHEVGDEFGERIKRIDLSGVSGALPHQIDATAA